MVVSGVERGVRSKQRTRGLTLVEIMIVVGIIAMVAAMIIHRYTHVETTGGVAAAALELSNVSRALEQYHTDHNTYPGSLGWQTVTPALFGGAGNRYLYATPSGLDGTGYVMYLYGDGTYVMCENAIQVGADLQQFNRFTDDGMTFSATPVAGASYSLCDNPTYGVVEWRQ